MAANLIEPDGAIEVYGAREHNLKNLTVRIPRARFVVVTGVSGSGKSTLAFDLLFAEGQRRFLDAMSAYARQYVEQLARPDVDRIVGIPPTVSIEQRNSRGGGKSTVATVTEVYHFLRLLFARLGTLFCPDCQLPVEAQTRDEVARRLEAENRERGDLLLLAPVVKNRKGFHTDVAQWAARHGYKEIRADGKIYATDEPFRLDRFREHSIEIVVGVLERTRRGSGRAAAQALVDTALELGRGTLLALDNHRQTSVHSTERNCRRCGRSFERLDPKHFSYHSPVGWCPRCRGFGELFYLPDVDRGARADAIEESWYSWQEGERELCPECGGMRLNPVARAVRLDLSGGSGTSPEAAAGNRRRSARVAKLPTIDFFARASVAEALAFFQDLKAAGRSALVARDILPEIRERLRFLDSVGLGYLQLGRGVPTLSGGEAQRIRLAAQLGSNLAGVLYILDEPTIGLHARDNEQLLAALARLQARGNSLLVVEHDEATMRHADYVIDLGPGAGSQGGEVVAAGTLEELIDHKESVTGRCLRERRSYPGRGSRRSVAPARASSAGTAAEPQETQSLRGRRTEAARETEWLELRGACRNNLKNLTVRFPLGRLTLVTGVSGSGKSTLLRECLLPALQERLTRKRRSVEPAAAADRTGPGSVPTGIVVAGHERVRAVYEVDQSPIGRTPRSVPATYVGFFDEIRSLFAQVPEARLRGYSAGRFSFNSAQGRCPECEGAGSVKLEMNFLPPAFTRCEACDGRRFSRETLDIVFRDRNIAQVLEMTVDEAREFFAPFPKIRRPLDALHDTGLGYLHLGQTSPTLSGGEAQRVKLVTHLLAGFKDPLPLVDAREPRNLFLLEEPTIGLHIADVRLLVDVLQRLVDAGHTVMVIEHNLDLIAEADWVIDLGPEGGVGGGRIVVAGTPETVAAHPSSHTGRFLRGVLGSGIPSRKSRKTRSQLPA